MCCSSIYTLLYPNLHFFIFSLCLDLLLHSAIHCPTLLFLNLALFFFCSYIHPSIPCSTPSFNLLTLPKSSPSLYHTLSYPAFVSHSNLTPVLFLYTHCFPPFFNLLTLFKPIPSLCLCFSILTYSFPIHSSLHSQYPVILYHTI